MKTDDLIGMLASGAPAVEIDNIRCRYVTALGWGAFGTLLLMTIWLGARRDIAAAALLPMFWLKLAFPAAMRSARWRTRCIVRKWPRRFSASGISQAC